MLLGAYLWGLHLDAIGGAYYSGDEPHYLLAAQSFAEDGNADVLDEYANRAYFEWLPHAVEPRGTLTQGRLNEPFAPGLPLVAAPAFKVGGPRAVELMVALFAVTAGALGYLLALRVAPDPWATIAAVAGGLSPPAFAYAAAVYPDALAAAALAGAALLTVRLAGARPRRREVLLLFALLGILPWVGVRFLPAGLVIGFFAFRSIRRSGRKLLAIIGAEVAFFSVMICVGFNEAVYGGPTPYSANDATTGADTIGEYAERTYRIAALLVDREIGLLRWAPVFALALAGGWILWRRSRGHLARAVLGLDEEHATARVCGLAIVAQLLTAAFLAPAIFGFEFPARHLVAVLPLAAPLVATGLRRAPRTGAVLAGLTLVATVWLWVAVRFTDAGMAYGRPPVLWGPLESVFPYFAGSAGAYVAAVILAVGAAVAAARAQRPVLPPV